MYRLIEEKITRFIKKETNKALLVTGARQVGKTYIIRKVLKKEKVSFFEVNFYSDKEILSSIKACTSIEEIITKLELYSNVKLKEKESVIFLDEIQLYPEIVTKIKFLVDQSKYKFILSGSLLGVILENISSVPVGYLEIQRMYPMTFFEFLIANKIDNNKLEYLRKCYVKKEKIDSLIHTNMMKLFSLYLLVGGMPSVVNTFLSKKNLNTILNEQTNIINLYKLDFTKYEQIDRKLRILSIYENIPNQLNKQNHKFIFKLLNNELKFDRYENSFLWLYYSNCVYSVFQTQEINNCLSMSKEKNSFKLFYNDVGLLTSNYSLDFKKYLIDRYTNKDKVKEDVYKYNLGGLFENFVCQELYAKNINPYYFKNKNIGELDFLFSKQGLLNIFEVKSGSDFTSHLSLNKALNYCKDNNISVDKTTVLSTENIFVENNIVYLPIYLISFIDNDFDDNVDLDLKLE